MPAWTQTTPPTWFPTAVASPAGWRDPVTGELLVAIQNLAEKGVDATEIPTFAAALVSAVSMIVGSYMEIDVTPLEPVAVTGIPKIALNLGAETRTLNYDKTHSSSTLLKFKYKVTATDPLCAAGTITIGSEITGGTIADILPGGGGVLVADRTFAAVDTSTVEIVEA